MTSTSDQKWDPKQYADQAGFVSQLGMPVVDLLAPQPNEQILDLGCGEGALTLKLEQLGCQVTGIDSSPDMIAKAKTLGLDVQVGNGESLDYSNEFDAVFSNAALHWMTKPEKVIQGVFRALKPQGRFVGEFGGKGNVETIVKAIKTALKSRGVEPQPLWYFPSPQEYQTLLEEAGFQVVQIELIERPTPLPGGMRGWLETFAQSYTKRLPAKEQSKFLDEVTDNLKTTLCDESGNWHADYVRLRFFARKTGSSRK